MIARKTRVVCEIEGQHPAFTISAAQKPGVFPSFLKRKIIRTEAKKPRGSAALNPVTTYGKGCIWNLILNDGRMDEIR